MTPSGQPMMRWRSQNHLSSQYWMSGRFRSSPSSRVRSVDWPMAMWRVSSGWGVGGSPAADPGVAAQGAVLAVEEDRVDDLHALQPAAVHPVGAAVAVEGVAGGVEAVVLLGLDLDVLPEAHVERVVPAVPVLEVDALVVGRRVDRLLGDVARLPVEPLRPPVVGGLIAHPRASFRRLACSVRATAAASSAAPSNGKPAARASSASKPAPAWVSSQDWRTAALEGSASITKRRNASVQPRWRSSSVQQWRASMAVARSACFRLVSGHSSRWNGWRSPSRQTLTATTTSPQSSSVSAISIARRSGWRAGCSIQAARAGSPSAVGPAAPGGRGV